MTDIRRPAVVGGVVAAALLEFFILHNGFGIDLAAHRGTSVNEVGAVAVAVTSLLAALAGWGLLALLEHRMARPRRVWFLLATAVFLVSLLGPLGGVSNSAKAGLAALHLTVAAIVILGLPRADRAERQRR